MKYLVIEEPKAKYRAAYIVQVMVVELGAKHEQTGN